MTYVKSGAAFGLGTASDQDTAPIIAGLASGNLVAGWTEQGSTFDAVGEGEVVALGGAAASGSLAFSAQDHPIESIAAVGDGFVVAATAAGTNGTDLVLQRYDASGGQIGTGIIVDPVNHGGGSDTSVEPMDAQVIATADGFAVTWIQSDTEFGFTRSANEAEFFKADGTVAHSSQDVSPAYTAMTGASLVALSSGDYLSTNVSGGSLVGVVLDQNGAPTGTTFALNGTDSSHGTPEYVKTAALGGNSFVAAWTDTSQDTGGLAVALHAQVFDAITGHALGDLIDLPPSDPFDVIALDGGGFGIAYRVHDAGGYSVEFQQYDATGHAVGAVTTVTGPVAGIDTISLTHVGAHGIAAAWNVDTYPGDGPYHSSLEAQVLATAVEADITAPASVTDGKDTTLPLALTLHDVTSASTSITITLDQADTTATGFTIGSYQASYAVSQSSASDYTVDLPSIAVPDGAHTTGGTLALTVHATGVVFANGTDTEVVEVTVYDADPQGTSGSDHLTGTPNHDVISGLGGDDQLYGLAGDDTLEGGYGVDRLDGGTGADTMSGGQDNDFYVVDNAHDKVIEAADAGTDTIEASVGWRLEDNVENLTLTGSADLVGKGNALENHLLGNAGANTLYGYDGIDHLDGGAGADTMIGGNGDDTYVVDNPHDKVIEAANAGIDGIDAYVSWRLEDNVEGLTLFGQATVGKGNALDNTIDVGNGLGSSLYGLDGADSLIGGKGADHLDGGTGADTMQGYGGNDTYVVDNAHDVVTEDAGAGTDTITASVGWRLEANVENLTLTGSAELVGKGNALDNYLIGNAGANSLYGYDGDDVIQGGLGRDVLSGGAGHDRFVFTSTADFASATGSKADEITDFGSGDKIDLSKIDAITGGKDNAFTWIGTAAFDGHAGELQLFLKAGNAYLFGDVNGDGHADFALKLDGVHSLSAADIML